MKATVVISKCIPSVNDSYACLSLPVQAPVPCVEMVVHLEAEIQGLKKVINNQQHYIQELHNSQTQQLEKIPNSHLGPDNLYRGTATFQMWDKFVHIASLQLQVVLKVDCLNRPVYFVFFSGVGEDSNKAGKIFSLGHTCK